MDASHAAASKLDFTLTQRDCEKEGVLDISDCDIHFREIDFSAFCLLSSPLELADVDDLSAAFLKVMFRFSIIHWIIMSLYWCYLAQRTGTVAGGFDFEVGAQAADIVR